MRFILQFCPLFYDVLFTSKSVSVVNCIVKNCVNEVHYIIQSCKNLPCNIVYCRICQVGSSSSSFGRLNYGNDQKVKCKHQFLAILRHRGQITTQAKNRIDREG